MPLFQDDSPAASLLPWMVVLFAFGAWLGRVDLLTPDEARHAEIAREMFEGGNWLTPRIYGEPYYDKPALFYWLIGASLSAFGPSAWAARLPSVLAALFATAMTAAWVRAAWGPGAARWTILMMGTTLFFVAVGRFVVVDMLLTGALTGALAWMGLLLLDSERRRPVWPMYACTAVGLLAKGPVAPVLVAAVAVVAALFERQPMLLLRLRPLTGLLIVVAIAAPWYVAAYLADPAYIETFLWHHNFARYAVPGALAHQQPWYFYLLAVPICLLPWSIVMAPALAAGWQSPRPAVRHALAWATVIIGFFSLSQTKLPTYVLAAFPPLLAIAAAYIDDVLTQGVELPRSVEATAVGWTILVASIAAGGAVWIVIESPSSWMRALLALPAIAVATWAFRHARDARSLVGAMAASSLALIATVYGGAADAVNSRESQRGAAILVREALPAHAALSGYRVPPHGLAFYAGRIVRRTNDPDAAVGELMAGADAALLTKSKFLHELGLEPLPPWTEVVWRSGDGHVLVVGGRTAEALREADAARRRREGVEPSADR